MEIKTGSFGLGAFALKNITKDSYIGGMSFSKTLLECYLSKNAKDYTCELFWSSITEGQM